MKKCAKNLDGRKNSKGGILETTKGHRMANLRSQRPIAGGEKPAHKEGISNVAKMFEDTSKQIEKKVLETANTRQNSRKKKTKRGNPSKR